MRVDLTLPAAIPYNVKSETGRGRRSARRKWIESVTDFLQLNNIITYQANPHTNLGVKHRLRLGRCQAQVISDNSKKQIRNTKLFTNYRQH